MKKYYYDLHIHSCLSPCGDNESTPNSIVGMGVLNGLEIMALTDHNSCKNCPAFFEAAKRYGITAIAGMELTTAEEIHIICLFETLENAMLFDKEVEKRRVLIENRIDIFGDQIIVDSLDNIICTEEYLLSCATDISYDEVPELVNRFNGVWYPAHIDRDSNSVISVLGTIPTHNMPNIVEIHNKQKLEELEKNYSLEKVGKVYCSDAHYLWDIKEKEDYFHLNSENDIIKELFKILRGNL